jgi:tetratricopeptide (TPR) repeat protein
VSQRVEMKPSARAVAFVAALFACVSAAAAARVQLERRPPPGAAGAPVYLPKAEYLRPMSLGYANVLADVLWFRAISYFGGHYRSDRTYPWLAHMCDLVTDLDPRAEHVYRFAGVILPWEAGAADEGIRMLEKGTQTFPDSWLLHYWLGFNYYFFKSDFAKAAFHMHRAATLPGAHPNAARLAALLYKKEYDPDTALAFLGEMERNADSGQMREIVRRHMLEARLADDLERLADAVEAYRARHGRIPPSIDSLVEAQLLLEIPVEPFGGRYVIDPQTGAVSSSSGEAPSRLHESPLRAKFLRGESMRDLF